MLAPPRASVIIPAHNAAGYLARALPALRSVWRDDYELIVVDDFSGDDTAAVAERAGARVIRLSENTGPSGARNAGAEVAQGEYLVFLDADVEVHGDTVALLLEVLERHPEVSAVFGSYDDSPADEHLVSRFKNLMHHYVHQRGSVEASTFWTGCSAIRRKTFEAVGPFNKVSLTCVEDIDYGHRLREAGHRVWLRRDIQCKHLKRWTLAGLVRTDVMQRGIPWTVMMLRRGKMDNDLNLGWKHRLSAVLAALAGGAVAAAAVVGIVVAAGAGSFSWFVVLLALALICTTGVVFLQRGFYQLLAERGGVGFAVACVPLHLLYYWYSVLSLLAGVMVFRWSKKLDNALQG